MPTVLEIVNRLRDQTVLPRDRSVGVKDLNRLFRPTPPRSVRSLLLKMLEYAINSLFEARAAAAISDAVGLQNFPPSSEENPEETLLEAKVYGGNLSTFYVLQHKCLAAMAYPDFFPAAKAGYLR